MTRTSCGTKAFSPPNLSPFPDFPVFNKFLTIISITVIVVDSIISVFYFFHLLTCSYLNPRVLPFFNSPPHPTETGGGRVSEQLLVFSCHLGLNNKKLLCCKTLQPLPVSLPLFRRRGVTAGGKRSRGKATVLEFSGQSLFFPQYSGCAGAEGICFFL